MAQDVEMSIAVVEGGAWGDPTETLACDLVHHQSLDGLPCLPILRNVHAHSAHADAVVEKSRSFPASACYFLWPRSTWSSVLGDGKCWRCSSASGMAAGSEF